MPYGTANGDSALARANDASFSISLSNKYTNYDSLHSSVYVSVNGFVSFDNYELTSSIASFSSLLSPAVAGLSMDLDTSSSGDVFYRETTSPSILASLKAYILAYNSSMYSSNELYSAFIVTYDSVPFYGMPSTNNNTFQIILATTAYCETFAIVIYSNISYAFGSDYFAGFSAKSGVLYKQIASSDISYLVSKVNSSLLPSYLVYKISSDSSMLTCSKENMSIELNFVVWF